MFQIDVINRLPYSHAFIVVNRILLIAWLTVQLRVMAKYLYVKLVTHETPCTTLSFVFSECSL